MNTGDLTPGARKVFETAKALPDWRGVDATHLTPAERRSLVPHGITFTQDRQNRAVATYSQASRVNDFRNAVLAKRAGKK